MTWVEPVQLDAPFTRPPTEMATRVSNAVIRAAREAIAGHPVVGEVNGKWVERRLLTIERDTQYEWHESETPFKSSRSGVGNGEDLLVEMVGGQLMGFSASWDVTDASGKRWEVKELSSGLVRLGTSGRSVSGGIMSAIEQVVNQLLAAYMSYGDELSMLLLPCDIQAFIDDDVPFLLRGEVPPQRFERLMTVIRCVSRHAHSTRRFHHVALDGMHHKVDSVTYARIVELIGADDVIIDIKSGILSKLQHPSFMSPDVMAGLWAAVDPIDVFPDVDGVIIVNSRGFRPIFRDQLRDQLRFNRISQMVPKFAYIGPPLETLGRTYSKNKGKDV